MVAITVVLLLVFLVEPKSNKEEPSSALSIIAYDINLNVGEKCFDFYEINDSTADISFDIDKSGIIYIDEEKIEGLKVGEVNVIMTAKTKSATTRTSFIVKVYQNTYSINFVALDSCSFEGDLIIATKNSFQFKVEVFDKSNEPIENSSIEITSSDANTRILNNFGAIIITFENDCQLTFILKDYSISTTKSLQMKKP